SSIWAVAFSPDGKLLAGGTLREIVLWEVGTGKEKARTEAHASDVTSLSFAPSGRLLASASRSEGPYFRVWEVATLGEVCGIKGPDQHLVTSLAFAPDGRTVSSGSV